MADITLRRDKGSPLTFQEVDDNFYNLNEDIAALQGDVVLFSDLATEEEATAGLVNNKWMSPLRVNQLIEETRSGVSLGVVLALG